MENTAKLRDHRRDAVTDPSPVLKEEHIMSRFVASLLQRLTHHRGLRQQRNPLQFSMDRTFFGNLVAR